MTLPWPAMLPLPPPHSTGRTWDEALPLILMGVLVVFVRMRRAREKDEEEVEEEEQE